MASQLAGSDSPGLPPFGRWTAMMNFLHSMEQLPLGIGMPGPLELAIIAGILLLLFGTRLPGVMRSMGRGVVEFKRGLAGDDDEMAGEEAPKDASHKEGS